MQCSIRLFADGCVIYKEITNQNDTLTLQSDLTTLSEWCSKWQMKINIEKTKHVKFGPSLNLLPNEYLIKNSAVESISSIKYLGVLFNYNLKWNDHVELITSKAFRKLGVIKRRLRLANSGTKLQAFNSLIKPSLEYASNIWHPHQAYLTDMLESIQSKSARFISSSYSSYHSVSSIKRTLGILPLVIQRKYSRLSFFHSFYHSDSSFSRKFIHPAAHISARIDHDLKVYPPFSRTKKDLHSPLVLSINDWNALPQSIANIKESSSFQSALLTYLNEKTWHTS